MTRRKIYKKRSEKYFPIRDAQNKKSQNEKILFDRTTSSKQEKSKNLKRKKWKKKIYWETIKGCVQIQRNKSANLVEKSYRYTSFYF